MIIRKTLLAIAVSVCTLSVNAQEKVLKGKDVPSEITAYVQKHFASDKIIKVVKDREPLKLSYEVKLKNNIDLEFNSKFEIIDIDSDKKLPDSVIPKTILEYVKTVYPRNEITDWEMEGTNQQIKLNNKVDLDFTADGDFIRNDK